VSFFIKKSLAIQYLWSDIILKRIQVLRIFLIRFHVKYLESNVLVKFEIWLDCHPLTLCDDHTDGLTRFTFFWRWVKFKWHVYIFHLLFHFGTENVLRVMVNWPNFYNFQTFFRAPDFTFLTWLVWFLFLGKLPGKFLATIRNSLNYCLVTFFAKRALDVKSFKIFKIGVFVFWSFLSSGRESCRYALRVAIFFRVFKILIHIILIRVLINLLVRCKLRLVGVEMFLFLAFLYLWASAFRRENWDRIREIQASSFDGIWLWLAFSFLDLLW